MSDKTYTAEEVKAILEAQKKQLESAPKTGEDLLAELTGGSSQPVQGQPQQQQTAQNPKTMKWMPKPAQEVYQSAQQAADGERILVDLEVEDIVEALNAMPLEEKLKFFDKEYESLLIKRKEFGKYKIGAFWLLVFEAEEQVQKESVWMPPYIKAHCRLYTDAEKFMRAYGIPSSQNKHLKPKFHKYVEKYTHNVMLAESIPHPVEGEERIKGWKDLSDKEKTSMKGSIKYIYDFETDKLSILKDYVRESDENYWRKYKFLFK